MNFLAPVVASLFLPLFAFAQQQPLTIYQPPVGANNAITFTSLANKFGAITNAVIPFLLGLALLFIIWGIFKYIASAGDTEKVAGGRKTIVYGIIAIFLMLSFWGFVKIIQRSLFG